MADVLRYSTTVSTVYALHGTLVGSWPQFCSLPTYLECFPGGLSDDCRQYMTLRYACSSLCPGMHKHFVRLFNHVEFSSATDLEFSLLLQIPRLIKRRFGVSSTTTRTTTSHDPTPPPLYTYTTFLGPSSCCKCRGSLCPHLRGIKRSHFPVSSASFVQFLRKLLLAVLPSPTMNTTLQVHTVQNAMVSINAETSYCSPDVQVHLTVYPSPGPPLRHQWSSWRSLGE